MADRLTIKVRPTCDVLDMHPGFEYEVEPSDIVEMLIHTGKLTWMNPAPNYEILDPD